MVEFKDRLRGLRCERRMTQSELARETGVSTASVGNWESGDNFPNLMVAVTLADALGVTLDELVGRE